MRRLVLVFVLASSACGTAAVAPSPPPPAPSLSLVELKYKVFEEVGRPWYCDPDFYPLARAREADLARQRLPEMRKDAATYAAILAHDGVPPGVPLTDAELLAVYHDWKDLQRLALTPAGPADVYAFSETLRPPTGQRRSDKVEGRVDGAGRVTVLGRSPAGFLECPICLAASTRIDTPSGPVPVTDLRVGDLVWTLGPHGQRVAAPVARTGSMRAPPGHEVIRVTLSDGRSVTASPGHPTADGRAIGSLEVGDELDGARVAGLERLPYAGRTYDLLPAGPSGAYWADEVLLGSTLRR